MKNKMKKMLAYLLCGLMAVSMLSGCGASNSGGTGENQSAQSEQSGQAVDASTFKTMGDVLDYESPQSGFDESRYAYVFEAGGTYYRAVTNLTSDVSEALWAIDFSDEQRDEKISALIGPLEIHRLDNLSEMIPSQDELDTLVGKTGQDLLDDGWTEGMGYNLADMEFYLNHGPFAYTVVFDGTLELGEGFDMDTFDWEEAVKPMTVKSVTYEGLGDATDWDMEET